jgi:transporter family-2 protein
VSKEAAVAATVVAGGLVAAQAPVNAALSRITGSLGAGTVNFAVGFAILVVLTFLVGGGLAAGDDQEQLRWYYLVGGAMGVGIVVTTLITVKTLGAGGVTAATIAGQLTLSLVLDRLGFLGLAERPLSLERMIGVALLAAGVFMIVRE